MESKYTLTEKDYLELWMYFQDKASSVKGALFNTITWIIGFAAALLGFTFSNLVDYDPMKAKISLSVLMILVSFAGLAICSYAFVALKESAKHIKNNWEYANSCLEVIEGLNSIVLPSDVVKAKKSSGKVMAIWKQLSIVVSLFFTAFFAVLLWALVIHCKA